MATVVRRVHHSTIVEPDVEIHRRIIDGGRGGNSARFLNHACTPNCEAIETGDQLFIHALAPIAPGDELFIDYALSVDGDVTDDIQIQYTCHCGTSGCRRTMLGSNAASA